MGFLSKYFKCRSIALHLLPPTNRIKKLRVFSHAYYTLHPFTYILIQTEIIHSMTRMSKNGLSIHAPLSYNDSMVNDE
jgi:hypothetical protein